MEEKKKASQVWFKLFGYPKGTKVRLKKELWKSYPYMNIFLKEIKGSHKIPVSKFIGEVVKQMKSSQAFKEFPAKRFYFIKWWADKREAFKDCFIWEEEYIDVL